MWSQILPGEVHYCQISFDPLKSLEIGVLHIFRHNFHQALEGPVVLEPGEHVVGAIITKLTNAAADSSWW